ncbi:MAG: DUF4040 domain-containing protein [Gammaproteobacteria bacterium]|nr:DUF4040 domain-containing protein [Gammaproteobacteria bacterium]
MTLLFGVFLLTLLVITAVAIIHTDNLFVAVMLTGIFSLMLAANFFILDAPDVALTEAAIGAGISTVLFLGALALTVERERPGRANIPALMVVVTTALIIIYATFDKPRFGDPNSPAHLHIAPWYLEMTPQLIDVPNAVTAVLGSFRGYDTFGEVFVVFTAGIGVLFIFGARTGRSVDAVKNASKSNQGLRHYLIPRVVGRLLIPFILLFGLYVQFHGDYGPGGGFQAGALVATSVILYALLEGEKQALRVLSRRVLLYLAASGALIYGLVGVAGILMGGTFLDYSTLAANPVSGQHIGILLIEAGVGITVTGVLLSIFHAFADRGKN